jgi:hypothetical protein
LLGRRLGRANSSSHDQFVELRRPNFSFFFFLTVGEIQWGLKQLLTDDLELRGRKEN